MEEGIVSSKDGKVLARLGQLHITALEAARVQRSRDYRMVTARWILAPWEIEPTHPTKQAG